MKTSMGIVLIVVGVILTVVGIVMVSGGNSGIGSDTVETIVSVAEMKAKREVVNPPAKSYGSVTSSGSLHDVVNGTQSPVAQTTPSSKKNWERNKTTVASKNDIEQQATPIDQNVENKPKTSKQKGDEFEDFTVNLLADWRMKLLRRTQDKMSSGGVVAESCKEPDLHIEQKRGNSKVDYHLECKYRSRWTDDAVTFEEWQIKR